MQDITRLRMLVELRRRGTLSAVADAFSYSTSAVSQNLAQLERDFGAPILAADGRRVKLTAEGEALVSRAEQILSAWEAAQAAVAGAADSLTGTVAVAAFQTASLVLVPPLLATMRRRHPGIAVRVTQSEPEVAVPGLLSRDVDLAITESYPGRVRRPTAGVVERPLFRDPMWIAAPSGTAATSLAELAEIDWVFEARGSPVRDWAVETCRRSGFEPRAVHETSDIVVQHALVRAGVAAAFVPGLTPRALLPDVELIRLAEEESREVRVATRESASESPLLAATIDALEESAPRTG